MERPDEGTHVVSEVDRQLREAPPRSDQRVALARLLSTAALVGIAVTLVIFAALHLLPPTSDITPVHRTLSEYALTSSAWAFDLAVIALAVSSVAVLVGAVLVRRIGPLSAGTVFGALWVVGLSILVSFPKHNWALGAIGSIGQIHWLASLVAFLVLPVAAMAIARRRGHSFHPVSARWAWWLGAAAPLGFLPMLYAVATAPRTWWQVIPLGLVERGLALTEVLALVALALLVRACTGAAPRAGGPAQTGTVGTAPPGSPTPAGTGDQARRSAVERSCRPASPPSAESVTHHLDRMPSPPPPR